MFLDDPFGDRQPKAAAAARARARPGAAKKTLTDVGQLVLGNSRTLVRDSQFGETVADVLKDRA